MKIARITFIYRFYVYDYVFLFVNSVTFEIISALLDLPPLIVKTRNQVQIQTLNHGKKYETNDYEKIDIFFSLYAAILEQLYWSAGCWDSHSWDSLYS